MVVVLFKFDGGLDLNIGVGGEIVDIVEGGCCFDLVDWFVFKVGENS